jgi:hypothetical protein
MEALEQLREQAGAAFEDLFTELRTKIAEHNQSSVLDSLRGFAAAVDWRVRPCSCLSEQEQRSCSGACSKVLTLRLWVIRRFASQEPWIIGLLIAQALIFLAVLLSRRRPRATMAIFFLAGVAFGGPASDLPALRHTVYLQQAKIASKPVAARALHMTQAAVMLSCSVAYLQCEHAFLHVLSSASGTGPQSGVSVRDAVCR